MLKERYSPSKLGSYSARGHGARMGSFVGAQLCCANSAQGAPFAQQAGLLQDDAPGGLFAQRSRARRGTKSSPANPERRPSRDILPFVTHLPEIAPERPLRMVQVWVDLHRDELLADWELAKEGVEPFRIDPLK